MSKVRVVVEVDLGEPVGECIQDTLDACSCRSCECDVEDASEAAIQRAVARIMKLRKEQYEPHLVRDSRWSAVVH